MVFQNGFSNKRGKWKRADLLCVSEGITMTTMTTTMDGDVAMTLMTMTMTTTDTDELGPDHYPLLHTTGRETGTYLN